MALGAIAEQENESIEKLSLREQIQPRTDEILGRDLRRQMGILLPSELASMLDCKETTLMSWRMAGTGPDFVKISKMVYYRIVDVQAWMEVNVKPTTRTMIEA